MEYVDAVTRAGGAPVLVPRTRDLETLEPALARLDGLLLPGGGDVVSLEFGEEPHPGNTHPDALLDRLEIEAARQAMARGMPVLGICRGIQVLAVAMGGALVQDIGAEVAEAIQHYARPREPSLVHTIAIEEGSLLAQVLGRTEMAVNSYHHQGVRDPGQGLKVCARSRDGVVEGLEASDGGPVLAVQCHPEELEGDYPEFRPLFEWVVREASAYRAGGGVGA